MSETTKPTAAAMRAAGRIGAFLPIPTSEDAEHVAAIIDAGTGLPELREALDYGKHIIADMLHGVHYDRDDLQRWVNQAEAALACAKAQEPSR